MTSTSSLISRLGGLLISRSAIQSPCLSRCLTTHSQHRFTTERLCAPAFNSCILLQKRSFHSTQPSLHYRSKKQYEDRNKLVFPPQLPDEPRRPAEIFFARRQIKYSQRKMWYIAKYVQGMMIDDAISQLALINKKGARIVREFLIEAQEEAVTKHNVEYKSNLHIADSFVGKGKYDHAVRYHGRGFRFQLDLVYCHYFFSLKEGPPPEEPEFTGYDQAERYVNKQRMRYVRGGL